MPVAMKKTNRGFILGEFLDRYGLGCSIQESSLAGEDALWLGVSDPKVQILRFGEGWKTVDLENLGLDPDKTLVEGRMHLTREQVRDDLLPLLNYFVEHGRLPEENR